MKAESKDLDRLLGLLRDAAEPASGEKERMLVSLRASMRTSSHASIGSTPPRVEAPGSSLRPLRAGLGRVPWGWIGGALLLGGAAGVALGFAWATAQSASERRERTLDEVAHNAGREQTASSDALPSVTRAASVEEAGDASRSTSTAGKPPKLEAAAPRATAPHPRARAARAPGARGGRRELALGDALELLHQAERALHADQAPLALALLGDLDRRAEPTFLRQERLTTLVLALCREGRADEAQAKRQDLQREFPDSIYSGRLERSCATAAGAR